MINIPTNQWEKRQPRTIKAGNWINPLEISQGPINMWTGINTIRIWIVKQKTHYIFGCIKEFCHHELEAYISFIKSLGDQSSGDALPVFLCFSQVTVLRSSAEAAQTLMSAS